ncbi:MAG TPA: glycoside hydrolase family 38 C-terminal domain-containing protein [Thermomicrobiales bacterium]|nr:glycoside hydrolase family 38 C-terminal domain-containing protein [Thermomicrobiales bacterium]
MDDFKQFDLRRLERQARWLGELRAWRNARVTPIQHWTFTGADGATTSLERGAPWPSVDTPVSLAAEATVPADWAGQPVEAQLWLGGEGFVVFTPGEQVGLNPFHQDFRLVDRAQGGETFRIEAEVVPKGMFGSHVGAPAIDRAVLAIPHTQVRALETDITMLIRTAQELQDHEILPRLLDLVDEAYKVLAPVWPTGTEIAKTRYISGDVEGGNRLSVGLGDYGVPGYRGGLVLSGIWHIPPAAGSLAPLSDEAIAACDRAREVIAAGLAELKQMYPPIGHLVLTGHAHIDLAWLWPVAETKRKARRTWSNVLSLMDRYDDFTFNQSSAQAYAWIEQDDPALFARIKERVAEGRWEPVGGSWVEPDSQVTGGEAFARQLFYGQRYFQSTFGVRNSVAWLPDVFGFSGGVPQLLLGAGIPRFFTIKVNWSERNKFPFDLFHWEGIDGSTVLAHTFFNPGEGYNGNIMPKDTHGTWEHFIGKRVHDQTLLSFGWGDGGGGPSEEMLENYARIKDYPVLPTLEMGKVEEMFANLPTEGLPTYVGELYLELHRGTLTTQALVKQLNRQSEHRLVEAEAFASLATLHGADYPHEQLDTAWQSLLLNQFHDILPGSSINEVYQDTHPELREVVATASRIRDEAIATHTGAGTGAYAIVNPTLDPRPLSVILPADAEVGNAPHQSVEEGVLVHDVAEVVGGLESRVLAPTTETSSSSASSEKVAAKGNETGVTLENALIRVEIGVDGTLHSVFDKRVHRDTLRERGNQLWAYVDRPRAWDAWDIDETYETAGEEITAVDSIEIVEEGPFRAAVRVTRTWRNSTFVQTYRLHGGSSRIDIRTHIDWHERLVLVRALFPTAIHTHEATFETMYGVQRRSTHRNTAWERARFEVGAHRFVDLSEPSYGVALLNDAKYGHSTHDGILGVSLVRGPLHPDPFADEGEHDFTYAFYPHEGNWVAGNVTAEARALNAPLVAVPVAADALSQPPFVTSTGVALGLGALKKAHDRDGLVLRVYEQHGDRGVASLTFDRPVTAVQRVNLLEEDIDGEAITVDGATLTFPVRPFEIVSLLIQV